VSNSCVRWIVLNTDGVVDGDNRLLASWPSHQESHRPVG
jgi:hypothetical protein